MWDHCSRPAANRGSSLLLIRWNGLQRRVRLQVVSNGPGHWSARPTNGCILSVLALLLCLPHYTHYSAACGLSNALPMAYSFGWGLDSFFQGHFINNPVCPVPVGWADVAAEFMTSEGLWPHSHCNRLFKFGLSYARKRGQLFEYPQEHSRSAAARLQQQNCLPPLNQGCSQKNTIIYDTVWYFSEVIDSPVSDRGKNRSSIHRM